MSDFGRGPAGSAGQRRPAIPERPCRRQRRGALGVRGPPKQPSGSALSFALDTSTFIRRRLINFKNEHQAGSLFWRQKGQAKNHDLAIPASVPRQHHQTWAIEITPKTEASVSKGALISFDDCVTGLVVRCGNASSIACGARQPIRRTRFNGGTSHQRK